MRTLLQIFVLVMGTVTAVRADISIALDNPDQTGLAGSTVQFFGTITNTGVDTVFLDSDDINFTGGPSFTLTDLFFTNVPISLGGGLTSSDIELFDITLTNSFSDPLGLYGGSYTLTGTADGGSQEIVVTTEFSVTAVTPEPGFSGILAIGMTGLLFATRRHRRQALEISQPSHQPWEQPPHMP